MYFTRLEQFWFPHDDQIAEVLIRGYRFSKRLKKKKAKRQFLYQRIKQIIELEGDSCAYSCRTTGKDFE